MLGRRDRVARDRRDVAVREVHLRAVRDAFDDRRLSRSSSEFQPTCGTLMRRCPAWRLSADGTRPTARRARGQSGASSLPSNSHCMPRQMPSSGRPSPTRCQNGVDPPRSSARVAPKWPTPGTMTPMRRRARPATPARTRRRRPPRAPSSPTSDCRLVVDEGNHGAPSLTAVLWSIGSILASRLSFAQATRSARANALNTASIL